MEVAAASVMFGANTLFPKGCQDVVSCYWNLCLVVVKKFSTNGAVLIPISYSFSHASRVSIKCWARSRKRYGYNCFQFRLQSSNYICAIYCHMRSLNCATHVCIFNTMEIKRGSGGWPTRSFPLIDFGSHDGQLVDVIDLPRGPFVAP